MESNLRNSNIVCLDYSTILNIKTFPNSYPGHQTLKMLLSIHIKIVQLNHRRHRLTDFYRPIFNIIWVWPQYTAPIIHNGTVAKLQSSANWTPYRIKHNPNNPKIPENPVNSSNPKSHRNPNNSRNPNNLSNHNEDHHQEAAPPPAVHHLEEELDRLTGKIVSFKRLFLNSEKIWGIRVFSNVVQSLPINSEFPI